MKFTDKLDKLMYEKGISRGELAKLSGVPYTTIVGFYDKGYDNVKLSTLQKLISYFKCSLDYLSDDEIDIDDKKPATISDDGRSVKFMELFKNMTTDQQDAFIAMMEASQPYK